MAQGYVAMNTSETLCLKWKDFQTNTTLAFGSMWNDSDFADVTLACEDGKQIKAHKLILASASEFFYNLLKTNKHNHPTIFMRGMKVENLICIVDLVYHGEVRIHQENLETFLTIAKELRLKGLPQVDVQDEKYPNNIDVDAQEKKVPNNVDVHVQYDKYPNKPDTQMPNKDKAKNGFQHAHQGNMAVKILPIFNDNIVNLDEQILSMMIQSQTVSKSIKGRAEIGTCRLWVCCVCGKEAKGSAMKEHIEVNHIEGIIVPCSLCEITFRTRRSLRIHLRRAHQLSKVEKVDSKSLQDI